MAQRAQVQENKPDDTILLHVINESESNYKNSHSYGKIFQKSLLQIDYILECKSLRYQTIRCNYPGFLPVALELESFSSMDNKRINFRIYISEDILVGHFKCFLKEMLQQKLKQLKKSDNLLLMIEDDVIIKHDIPLKDIYAKKVEDDGWLYIKLSFDN